ncbi:MAG: cation-transporting P-type ATPase [Thermodesulfobacteriota bacterium]|nr:cation-transporting P-type ATPase [Thermodesulfobacteriota bacterium]
MSNKNSKDKNRKDEDKIKQMPVDDALDHFSSDPKQGISENEAKKRLEKYGENKIEEEKKSPILKFLSYFWGPIPFMLEAAIILGAVVQRWEEFGVMLTMLLINVGVSFWHDRQAEDAIEPLKEKLALEWDPPYAKWSVGGRLNAYYQCLDRHVKTWRKRKGRSAIQPFSGKSTSLPPPRGLILCLSNPVRPVSLCPESMSPLLRTMAKKWKGGRPVADKKTVAGNADECLFCHL